jgi:hypothetical protein
MATGKQKKRTIYDPSSQEYDIAATSTVANSENESLLYGPKPQSITVIGRC